MRQNRLFTALLACMLLFSCSFISAAAAETPGNDIVISRVSGRLNHSFPANTITPIGDSISLDKDETVTYNCTYTPKSASLDFGIIDSNNVFHYLNCTSGSINQSIKIDTAGQYTLAIRNNESYAVTVTGTVRY